MSRFTHIDHDNKEVTSISDYRNYPLLSLEQALESILPHLDGLDFSIKVAKQCCCYPSEHGLTRDESAAIYLYTMERDNNSFYRALSQVLRTENRHEIEPWFAYLRLFDAALSKLPTLTTVMWRGVSDDISNQYKKNQIITWSSISSCSFPVGAIEDLIGTDGTLFKIDVINGKNVSRYIVVPNETEVLLRPGTRLRVESNGLNHTGGLHLIHLVEVNGDTDPDAMDLTQKPSDVSTFVSPETRTPNDSMPSSQIEPPCPRNHRVRTSRDDTIDSRRDRVRERAAHLNGDNDPRHRGHFNPNPSDTGTPYYGLNAADAIHAYFIALDSHLFLVLT